jgi:hypothetical protein
MAEAHRLKRKKELASAEAELLKPEVSHLLSMQLWDGATMAPKKMRWQSKRLPSDLAFGAAAADSQSWLARADRAGRAAGNASAHDPAGILGLFEQEEWNGRLQAPRKQLETIARARDNSRISADKRRSLVLRLGSRLEWLVTLSAELQPQGPWFDYTQKLGLKTWPHADENKKREGHAKRVLCRLPSVRVLSVDLGHRHAAACAVWETLTEKQMTKECEDAGRRPPKSDDLCLHVVGKRAGKPIKTIYRRTGKDMWARLDRQFTIKLQGEDRSARRASPMEMKQIRDIEKELGRTRTEDNPLPHAVDDLMSDAVRSLRLGLRRHGDQARVAFNLTTDDKPMPGGGKRKLTEESRRELLHDTLMLWQSLFNNPRWQDGWARELWQQHVRAELPPPPGDEAGRAERKTYDKKVRELLTDYAAKLTANPQLRMRLHGQWATRWRADDAAIRTHLREMRNWILPHGKARSDRTIRHVGGLSLTRLATIRGLWQVEKAYAMRPEPDELRKNVPKKDESNERFGQRILDALEDMRENRVKQLASRIVEAALGIGKEQPKVNGRESKRPRERVYPTCHAVVIENLDNYRPDEIRTRRENRQLMQWSAGQVRTYLKESCELYGLHLREVYAGYTSRQDSRTGRPGVRCADVPIADFLRRFKPRVEHLRKRDDAESEFLTAAYDYWNAKPNTEGRTVRVPRRGGDIFVSAHPDSPAAKGLQADLNAAANIGLKALLDPDWPGKWWYVPCDAKTHVPVPEKVKGGAAHVDAALAPAVVETEGKPLKSKKASGDITNFWRDPSAAPIAPGDWKETTHYWNEVKFRVIANLRRQAGL